MFIHCLVIWLHYLLSILVKGQGEYKYSAYDLCISWNLHHVASVPKKCKYGVPLYFIYKKMFLISHFWN